MCERNDPEPRTAERREVRFGGRIGALDSGEHRPPSAERPSASPPSAARAIFFALYEHRAFRV
jgi:hypothetical protein